jgi:hypothetical protein
MLVVSLPHSRENRVVFPTFILPTITMAGFFWVEPASSVLSSRYFLISGARLFRICWCNRADTDAIKILTLNLKFTNSELHIEPC